jgi:hypothetical protein
LGVPYTSPSFSVYEPPLIQTFSDRGDTQLTGSFAHRQKERKLTERKDSWDISTMFTDEANLPDAEEMIDVEPERGGAGAALADGDGALVPLDEDQPQALQKITQVRVGVEMKFKFRRDGVDATSSPSTRPTRRRRRRCPVRVYASREGAAVSRRCRSTQAAEL